LLELFLAWISYNQLPNEASVAMNILSPIVGENTDRYFSSLWQMGGIAWDMSVCKVKFKDHYLCVYNIIEATFVINWQWKMKWVFEKRSVKKWSHSGSIPNLVSFQEHDKRERHFMKSIEICMKTVLYWNAFLLYEKVTNYCFIL
jgi:hypothetical protein